MSWARWVCRAEAAAALPDPDRGHEAILITVHDRHYLFDCGHGATLQIIRSNVNPATVNTLFFSHLHFDHIADFPFFMIIPLTLFNE